MADHTVNVGVVVDVKGEEKLAQLNKDVEGINKKSVLAQTAAAASIKQSITANAAASQVAARAAGAASIKQALAANTAAKAVGTTSVKQATAVQAASIKQVAAVQAITAAEADAVRARRMANTVDISGIAEATRTERIARSIRKRSPGWSKEQALASAQGIAVKPAGGEPPSIKEAVGGGRAARIAGDVAGIAAITVGITALAAAAAVATVGLAALAGTLGLITKSAKWAGEAADKQIDTFDRMFKHRTTFPQEMARNAAGIELIGKDFEDLNDKITDKKFLKSDFAKNWDITPGALQKVAAKRPAAMGRTAAPDTLDILEAAVKKREELQNRFDKALPGSKASKEAMRLQRLFAKDVEELGPGFAKAARTLKPKNVEEMKAAADRIAGITFTPQTAEGAHRLKQAFWELGATFDTLKNNIGAAVIPQVTRAAQNAAAALQPLIPSLSRLGAAVAGKGWEVIGNIADKIAQAAGVKGGSIAETIENIAKAISEYPAENISDKIASVGESIISLATSATEAAATIKAAIDLLTPEGQKKALLNAVEPEEETRARNRRIEAQQWIERGRGVRGPFDQRPKEGWVPGWSPDRMFEKKPVPVTIEKSVPGPEAVRGWSPSLQQPPEDVGAKIEQGATTGGQNLVTSSTTAATNVANGGSTGGHNFADAVAGIPWASYSGQLAAGIAAAIANIPKSIAITGAPGSGPSKGGDTPAPAAAPAFGGT